MDVTVTSRACRELCVREALHAVRAVNAHGLLGDYVTMAFPATVHRIESAPVPAVPANVAIEAFRRAVRSALELSHIDFMAIVTRLFFLGIGELQPEQQTRDEDSGRDTHGSVLRVRFGKPGYQLQSISNITGSE
jgi:hypothetical protein